MTSLGPISGKDHEIEMLRREREELCLAIDEALQNLYAKHPPGAVTVLRKALREADERGH